MERIDPMGLEVIHPEDGVNLDFSLFLCFTFFPSICITRFSVIRDSKMSWIQAMAVFARFGSGSDESLVITPSFFDSPRRVNVPRT